MVFSHLSLFSCPPYTVFFNGMLASQSPPKKLFDLNKETLLIVALVKMHKIGERIVNG